MLLTILLSAVQIATTAILPQADSVPTMAAGSNKCGETMHQADGDVRPTARRLDQLPPGRLELTVLRQMGSCPEPVVLREGIGGNPDSPDRLVSKRR